jgi:D-sedoheptulose 7-phosphate isomerase
MNNKVHFDQDDDAAVTSPSDCASSRVFLDALEEHLRVGARLRSSLGGLEQVAKKLQRVLREGGTIFWCGNGGSAADSQHLAAELVGRFRRERSGLSSVALTTDSSALTSISNDYGFENVFARQVEAHCRPGDAVVGISTSGNSPNVCEALKRAKELGAYTFAMTGEGGGQLASVADDCLMIDSLDTARIQEMHILAGHMLCDWIEIALSGENSKPRD